MKRLMLTFENEQIEHILIQLRLLLPTLKNETTLNLLAYIHIYGDNAKKELLKDGIFKSSGAVDNYICSCRKGELIAKERLEVTPLLKLHKESVTYSITLLNLNEETSINRTDDY